MCRKVGFCRRTEEIQYVMDILVREVLPQISVFAFKHCHVYSIIIVILYRRLLDDGIRQ